MPRKSRFVLIKHQATTTSDSQALINDDAEIQQTIEEKHQLLKTSLQQFYKTLVTSHTEFQISKQLIESSINRKHRFMAFTQAAEAGGKLNSNLEKDKETLNTVLNPIE